MDELELVRLHEDGERLVLVARDGAQSTLPITDALRAAIRGDRPRMESIRAQEESALRPREIQARLRAGETVEQLAEASGLPVEHVRRFEYPVISEREHSISRVRAKAVLTDDDGATTLGEVADERLRSRGVRPDDARWSATREGTHPWIVQVEFTAAERPRVARWSLEPRGGFVEALDDEARWLGLPEDDGGPALAGVSALSPLRGGQHPTRPAPPEPDDTDLLLDNLSERRGQRPARRPSPDHEQPHLLDPDDLPDAAGDEPAGAAEPAEQSAAVVDIGARRGGSRPRMPSVVVPDSPADMEWEAPSQWEIPGPGRADGTEPGPDVEAGTDSPEPEPAPDAPAPEPAPEKPQAEPRRPAAKRGRKSRAQVPSWDEIVFGSRPEI
ncbi:septation protein SepH [Promicromonospora sp. NPDC052451]|uniref:septation protein SepH n=1 Tax=Promicromonospora sp. NPDC052451 TaxID=3364407 RepID=UPI0037C69B35